LSYGAENKLFYFIFYFILINYGHQIYSTCRLYWTDLTWSHLCRAGFAIQTALASNLLQNENYTIISRTSVRKKLKKLTFFQGVIARH
jgi:hypothetical protein